MSDRFSLLILPGDGIGPEVIAQARRVLDALDLDLTYEEAPVGGAAYMAAAHPLPPDTLALAERADAVLFGAVGDPQFDALKLPRVPLQGGTKLKPTLDEMDKPGAMARYVSDGNPKTVSKPALKTAPAAPAAP